VHYSACNMVAKMQLI